MKRLIIIGLLIFNMLISLSGCGVKGLKGGTCAANFYGNDSEGWKSDNRGSLGLFWEKRFNDYIYLQPEILIPEKGAKTQETTVDYGTLDLILSIGYIEVPILVKFSKPFFQYFTTNVLIGPYFAVLYPITAGFLEIKGGQWTGVKHHEVSGRHIREYDFGIIFGGGIGFNPFGKTLSLEVRYSASFLSIAPEIHIPKLELSSVSGKPDLKNSAIYFMIGYSFWE